MKQRIIDRPVKIVYREVEGLPKGTVKAVIDAYGELVDEGCLAIFGPSISDNCVPTREAIEQRFRVPAVSVTGTDDWLGEWTFSFPQGSLTDEPIFWADLLAKGGHTEVGVLIEQSLVGETYLKNFRSACRSKRHPDRRGGADRPDRAGRRRCGPQGARSEAERTRSLRLRLRNPARQHGAAVARLGSAALHEHRVPERLDQPRDVESVHGVDGGRPVRRGQPRRPALPRSVRSDLRSAAAVLRAGREPGHRHHAAARLRRRPSAEPARRQGGARAREDASRRGRRTRHAGLVREVDPPRPGWAPATSWRASSIRTGSTRISSIALGRTNTMATQQTLPSTASTVAALSGLATAIWLLARGRDHRRDRLPRARRAPSRRASPTRR